MSHESGNVRISPAQSQWPPGSQQLPSIHNVRALPPIHSGEHHNTYTAHKPVPYSEAISRPSPSSPSVTTLDQRSNRAIGMESLLNPSAGGPPPGRWPEPGDHKTSPQVSSFSSAHTASGSKPPTPRMPETSLRRVSSASLNISSINSPPTAGASHFPARATTPRSPVRQSNAPRFQHINPDARTPHYVQDSLGQHARFVPHGMNGNVPHYVDPRAQSHGSTSSRPRIQPAPSAYTQPQSGPNTPTYLAQAPHERSFITNSNTTVGSRSSSPTRSLISNIPATASTAHHQHTFTFDSHSSASSPPASGQYQMMTLDTESGLIQVPVDVQAASKSADEKRKRNATASHRFRQRRKEKEAETSVNIARLEAQIRTIADEKDFYLQERDFFYDLAVRNQVSVPPRPMSPRRRCRPVSLGSAPLDARLHTADAEGVDAATRNVRRRTGTGTYDGSTLPIRMGAFVGPAGVQGGHMAGHASGLGRDGRH